MIHLEAADESGTRCGLRYGVDLPAGDTVITDPEEIADATCPNCHVTEQTWTFVGHWHNDRIEIDYVLPGEQADERIDVGAYPEGLWAAAGGGATIEEAQANAVAEYEHEVHAHRSDPAAYPWCPICQEG